MSKESNNVGLDQCDIIDLFIEKLSWIGGEHKSFVANKADPTQVDTGEYTVWLDYGFSRDKENHDHPLSEAIKVHWMKFYAGIEFVFQSSIGRDIGYYEFGYTSVGHGDQWLRATKGFFNIFKRLLVDGKPVPFDSE